MSATGAAVIPQCIVLRPTLVATVIEDGAVLLDLDSKYFYALNQSAWAILQLCETACAAPEDILERCKLWGANDQSQIRNFLLDLLSHAIVEPGAEREGLPDVRFHGVWTPPLIERQAEPLQTIVTSAFDPSIPLAE